MAGGTCETIKFPDDHDIEAPFACIRHESVESRTPANYLKVEPRTLLLWARQQKVKGFILSGTKRHVWRFRVADLDTALVGPDMLGSESPAVLSEKERIM